MKRLASIFVTLLIVLLTAGALQAQQLPATNYTAFDASFAAPALTGVGLPTVTYTAGTIYQGGAAKAISAGTLGTLGASNSSCASPLYSSCGFIYWTSSTTLSYSTTWTTANAAGNVMVAFVTTDASSNVLAITPASLDLAQPNVVFADCGTTVTNPCTSTNYQGEIVNSGIASVSSASGASIIGLTKAYTSTSTYGCNAGVTGSTTTKTTASVANTGAAQISLFINLQAGTGAGVENVYWRCSGH